MRRPLWRLVAAIFGATLVAMAVGYFIAEQFRRSELTNATAGQYSPSPVVSDPSVAVLPFLDLSENQDQGYFADGMAEEVINGRVTHLGVLDHETACEGTSRRRPTLRGRVHEAQWSTACAGILDTIL